MTIRVSETFSSCQVWVVVVNEAHIHFVYHALNNFRLEGSNINVLVFVRLGRTRRYMFFYASKVSRSVILWVLASTNRSNLT